MQYSFRAPASSYDDGGDVDEDGVDEDADVDAGPRQGPGRAPAPQSRGQVADGAGRCSQISQIKPQITLLCNTFYHLISLSFIISSYKRCLLVSLFPSIKFHQRAICYFLCVSGEHLISWQVAHRGRAPIATEGNERSPPSIEFRKLYRWWRSSESDWRQLGVVTIGASLDLLDRMKAKGGGGVSILRLVVLMEGKLKVENWTWRAVLYRIFIQYFSQHSGAIHHWRKIDQALEAEQLDELPCYF